MSGARMTERRPVQVNRSAQDRLVPAPDRAGRARPCRHAAGTAPDARPAAGRFGRLRTMRYHGNVIRPPSEADSLILQVTYGCSNNSCDFCGTYLDKPFAVRPPAEVEEDVLGLHETVKRRVRRVFLADGDALALSTRRMLEVLAPAAPRAAEPGARQQLRQRAQPAGQERRRAAADQGGRTRAGLPGARVRRRPDARRHPQRDHGRRADRGMPARLAGRHRALRHGHPGPRRRRALAGARARHRRGLLADRPGVHRRAHAHAGTRHGDHAARAAPASSCCRTASACWRSCAR